MKPRRRALVRALVVVCALPALGCGARASSSSAATSPPSVTAASPAPTGGPLTLTSRRIAVLAEGALVIDADSGVLFRVDRAGREVARLAIGADAGQLAYDPAREVAFVADRRGDALIVVDVAGMRRLAAWPTPAEPYAVALSPDAATVLVATIADRALVALDARTGARAWTAPLAPEPRGLAVSPDGARALVSSVASGGVDELDLRGDHRVTSIAYDLQCLRCEPGSVHARGAGAVEFLDSQRAVATFQRAVPEALVTRSTGYGGAAIPPVTHHVAFLAFDDAGAHQAVAQVPDHQPRSLVWDAPNDSLYVAGLGSESILHLPRLSTSSMDELEMLASDAVVRARERCGVDGAVLTPEGDLLLWCSFTRSVLRLSGLGPILQLAEAARLTEGPTLAPSRRDAVAHEGLVLFHANRAEINTDHALACASCHVDGRSDGLTWQITGRRHQTPVLAGRLRGTAPYKWDGSDPTLEDSLRTTIRRLHGDGLDAGQARAILAYLDSLPAPRGPTRDAGAIERGRAVFEGAGCATCHEGAAYTDRERHVFRGGEPVDTPSLIGLAASAPYLHDGSARTLTDVVRGRGSVPDMADTDDLTEQEVTDLVAFLETR